MLLHQNSQSIWAQFPLSLSRNWSLSWDRQETLCRLPLSFWQRYNSHQDIPPNLIEQTLTLAHPPSIKRWFNLQKTRESCFGRVFTRSVSRISYQNSLKHSQPQSMNHTLPQAFHQVRMETKLLFNSYLPIPSSHSREQPPNRTLSPLLLTHHPRLSPRPHFLSSITTFTSFSHFWHICFQAQTAQHVLLRLCPLLALHSSPGWWKTTV